MNKKFNLIINTLIILLIIALIMVMMNYYADTDIIPTFIYNSGDDVEHMNTSGDLHKEEFESKIDENVQEERKESGEKVTSGETIENNKSIIDTLKSGDGTEKQKETDMSQKKDSPLIMTSENEISNKEKREILTELDKTLMDLLEVVDKVQIVDENRLIKDDSEVQEWKK